MYLLLCVAWYLQCALKSWCGSTICSCLALPAWTVWVCIKKFQLWMVSGIEWYLVHRFSGVGMIKRFLFVHGWYQNIHYDRNEIMINSAQHNRFGHFSTLVQALPVELPEHFTHNASLFEIAANESGCSSLDMFSVIPISLGMKYPDRTSIFEKLWKLRFKNEYMLFARFVRYFRYWVFIWVLGAGI